MTLSTKSSKGTGNMEVHLDRGFGTDGSSPHSTEKSGTRHEELLFDKETQARINTLRRMLSLLTPEEALDRHKIT